MAVVISGSNQYTSTSGIPGSAWTLTAWLRTGTIGASGAAVGLHQSGSVAAHVFLRDTGDLQLIDYGSYAFNGVNPLAASADTWYRVAVVAASATNVTFYRAAATGALGSGSVTDFAGPATPTTVYIGDHFYDEPWLGRIAGVKVWDAALTQAEVEAELAQYVPRRVANLLHFHPFVSAESTDYSGGNNSLTGGSGATTADGPPIPWAVISPRLILPASVSGTNANAEAATATGAANDAQTAVAPVAEHAAATAAAADPSVSVAPAVAEASAGAAAETPQTGIAPAAGTAAAAATAPDPSATVAPVADAAVVTAAALDATVTTGSATTAAAETATAAAAALDATAVTAVLAAAEAATAVAAALDLTALVAPAADVALALAAALDAFVSSGAAGSIGHADRAVQAMTTTDRTAPTAAGVSRAGSSMTGR